MVWSSTSERRSAFFQAAMILRIIMGGMDRERAAGRDDCWVRRSCCSRFLVMCSQWEALLPCGRLAAGGSGGRHSCGGVRVREGRAKGTERWQNGRVRPAEGRE